jgi:hypothetical protein
LMDFLYTYEKDHPEIEYLYQDKADAKGVFHYVSNKAGVLPGTNDRAEYVALLRSARIGFYSTPGIDGGAWRTGGFDPVTPRLFELLAAGCHVIARYPDNADTDFYRMKDLCPSVDTYEAFRERLEVALRSEPPMATNSAYLEQHYTSNRIALLKEMLQNLSP